jgi:hypothetical protein
MEKSMYVMILFAMINVLRLPCVQGYVRNYLVLMKSNDPRMILFVIYLFIILLVWSISHKTS